MDITAYYDPTTGNWKGKVTQADQPYKIYWRLLPGVSQASVGAATVANYCGMITDLSTLGYPPNGNPQWYMVEAVQAHELQHVTELKNSVDPEFAAMKTAIENLTVRNDCSQNMTAATAKNGLKALAGYNAAITTADTNSTAVYNAIPDPNANTDAAEHAIVDPVVTQIQQKATANNWAPCP